MTLAEALSNTAQAPAHQPVASIFGSLFGKSEAKEGAKTFFGGQTSSMVTRLSQTFGQLLRDIIPGDTNILREEAA